jgi:hypothetical protein
MRMAEYSSIWGGKPAGTGFFVLEVLTALVGRLYLTLARTKQMI